MMPSKWQSAIDRALQKAYEEGQMSNLPGEGKPLKLDEDSNTPEELKLAYRMLKEQGFAPDWIMQGRELDDQRARLMANIERGAKAYRGALAGAERLPAQREERVRRANDAWALAKQTFQQAAKKFNQQVTTYNLKVPQGVTHKALINVDRELARLLP